MAKIKFGGVALDARGSIDGVTYARNRNGAYARKRTSPVQPRGLDPRQVRQNLAFIASTWRTLSAGARTLWTDLGATIIRTDSLGDSYNLTGIQAFELVNMKILQTGGALELVAPALDTPPSILTASVVADDSAQTVELTSTNAGGDTTNGFYIFATAGFSAGRQFVRKSEYRWLASMAGDAASPFSLTSVYNAKYGGLVLGEKISFLLVPFSTNQIPGVPVRVDTIVVA